VWRPDPSGQWPDPDRLRQGFIAERRGERELLLTAGLTLAEVDRASALLDLSPDPPRTGFVLCHGDVSPEHVFIDEALHVSALIDWGEWHGGSPVGELALVATTFGWDDLEPVLQGYGHDSSNGDVFQRELATTAVGQLTGHIAHHMRLKDPDGAAQNVVALRLALRILG
jgi:aminoglycoside phosphotransferase (APT) family kinase protein